MQGGKLWIDDGRHIGLERAIWVKRQQDDVQLSVVRQASCGVKSPTVQLSANIHLFLADDGANFHERFNVIIGVKEREATSDDAQDYDTDGPNVDCCIQQKPTSEKGEKGGGGRTARKYKLTNGLVRTFEEDFWGSEASCASSVGSDGRPLLLLGLQITHSGRLLGG